MFSLKNLIGTPLKQENGEQKYEFTPIGGKSRVIPPAEVIRDRGREPLGRPRNSLNIYPTSRKLHDISVVNNTIMESSFDDTTDNFHNTTFTGIRPHSNNVNRPNEPTKNSQFSSKIVDNGMYSIKEQQNELQRLQTENYNLKIEVATLTKFLKQTPEEQRNIATENIELKQQLMESIRRIQELETSVSDLRHSNKENLAESSNQEDLKQQYKQIIEERDDKIEDLANKIEYLQNKQPSIPNELLDKLEYLQGENQSLRRKLDDLSENLEKIPEDVLIRLNNANEENHILKNKIDALNHQLQEAESDNHHESAHNDSMLENYKSKIDSLDDKLRETELEKNSLIQRLHNVELDRDSFAEKLNEQEFERNSLRSDIKALRHQLEDQKDELISRENEAQSWKDKFRSLNVEFDGVANTRNSAMNNLKQELIELQESKDDEVRKLKRQLSSLTEELDESRNQEANLKNQLKAAINSKATHSRSINLELHESEINSMKVKELKLVNEIQQLKEELAELQDKAYQTNVDSRKYESLQQDHTDILDRISYYEKEYSLVQDALENAEAEIESLNKNKISTDATISQLEEENAQLLHKLKSGSNQKPDNSEIYEIERATKKRAEQEKQKLVEEIDDLKFQLRRLQKELEFEKNNKDPKVSTNSSYLESELQKLSKEKNLLKLSNNDNEIEIGELKSKCNKLQSVISDKESLIESLESRIRDLNKQFKLHSLSDNHNSEDIFEIKKSYTNKLKQLEYEYQKLEADYRNQATYYESKINEIYDMQLKNDFNRDSDKFASPMTVLLEQQLQHSRTLNNEISKKLSDSLSNESKLSNQLSEIRLSLSEIVDKNEKLLREKAQLEDEISTFETDSKILKSENSRLELKTKNLTNELNTSFKHCTKLANKLHELDVNGIKNSSLQEEDILRAKRNNDYLRKQIDTLNQKLAFVKNSPPPSPEPRKSDEIQLLRHQLQYYRAVLHDMNLKYNDLATMNNFIMKAIKNSNQSLKDDLVKLAHCGIYPDYSSMDLQKLRNGGKISFKIVAQFVLAMVKIKRRKEKADSRRLKLQELKSEIERETINVLAG